MRILVIAMPRCGNFGDDIISEFIQRQIVSSYDDVEIAYLCGNCEISGYQLLNNSRALPFPKRSHFLTYRTKKKEIVDFASSCDLIYVGGGGLFQDSHHPFTIHYFLKWIQFANCPVIVTGVGVGPINYWFNFYYLRRILGLKGIQIQVRDSESYSIFRNLSLNNVTLNCDLVEGSRLDVFTNLYELNENYKMVLGCSIRPWGGLTVTSVKDLILRIVKEKSIDHIKFFVFEYADDNLSEYNFQIEIMRELGEISAEVVIYHGQLDFLKELGTVNFAVASRYHANIIWQKLNVPTIPIAYAPKVSSLYKKFGYKALTINEMLNNIVESDFISIALDSNYSFPKDLSSKLSLTFSSRMTFFFYDLLEFLGDIFVSAKSRLKIIGKS